MNNDIKITSTLEWTDGEGNESARHYFSLGSILNIRSAFESAEENLGKLESYINRLIVKADNQHKDED